MTERKKIHILSGIWAWMLERYPPAIILLHGLVYLTAVAVSQYLHNPENDAIQWFYVRDGLGIYAFFLFPLVLRIMDEHKDYEGDHLTVHCSTQVSAEVQEVCFSYGR